MEKSLNRNAVIFLIVTAFLNTTGIGLIVPVVPFLVQGYTDPVRIAEVVGWLSATYALCSFFAAPMLGALSDRYGRRPILMICLLGSAIGYALFGLGGALWVLFLGRIIDGVTGGNTSIIYASLADATPRQERGKYYGMIGAASGVGFMLGPGIGALASKFGYQAPLYITAGFTLVNLLWGLAFFPETLAQQYRSKETSLAKINPFRVLSDVFAMVQLRWLLIATFLFATAITAFQTVVPVLGKDVLQWNADTIGILFLIAGLTDIVGQGVLIRWLQPVLGEARIAFVGLLGEVVGFVMLFLASMYASPFLTYAGVLVITLGDALVIPSVGGLISQLVSGREQGKVQGGNLAIQSISRVIGPFVAGESYTRFGRGVPFWGAALTVGVSLVAVALAIPSIRTHQLQEVRSGPPSSSPAFRKLLKRPRSALRGRLYLDRWVLFLNVPFAPTSYPGADGSANIWRLEYFSKHESCALTPCPHSQWERGQGVRVIRVQCF